MLSKVYPCPCCHTPVTVSLFQSVLTCDNCHRELHRAPSFRMRVGIFFIQIAVVSPALAFVSRSFLTSAVLILFSIVLYIGTTLKYARLRPVVVEEVTFKFHLRAAFAMFLSASILIYVNLMNLEKLRIIGWPSDALSFNPKGQIIQYSLTAIAFDILIFIWCVTVAGVVVEKVVERLLHEKSDA